MGNNEAQATPDVAATEPEEPVEPGETVILTFEHPDLGTILTDGAGHTLWTRLNTDRWIIRRSGELRR